MLGLSCRTTQPHTEPLSDYYWEVQHLRMQAGKASLSGPALRDLGVIYLRTGHFEEAREALTLGLTRAQSDARLWFYAGLAQEILGFQDEALATYERSPFLTIASAHSEATKGRIAWMREAVARTRLAAALGQTPASADLSPTTYAVFPLVCSGASGMYTGLGRGLGSLLAHDLNQHRNVEVISHEGIRAALDRLASGEETADPATLDRAARALGAGKAVGGTCALRGTGTIEMRLVVHDLMEGRQATVEGTEQLAQVFALEDALLDQLLEELNIWQPNRPHRVPIPASEALVSYGRGLEQEEAGELRQSAESFRRALAFYPRFAPAGLEHDRIQTKILSEGAGQQALVDLIVRLEYSAVSTLLNTRLQQVDGHINVGILPGQDNRKLPPGNVGELPTPPRPTGPSGNG